MREERHQGKKEQSDVAVGPGMIRLTEMKEKSLASFVPYKKHDKMRQKT
jgi:hypothetical protein